MKRTLFLVLIVLLPLLVACEGVVPSTGNVSTPPPIQGAPDPADAPEAALRVRDAFAQSLNAATDEVAIISWEAVEWPDSCLGAAAADEMCAQVITPGYSVVVEYEGEQTVLHTDEGGDAWRVAP